MQERTQRQLGELRGEVPGTEQGRIFSLLLMTIAPAMASQEELHPTSQIRCKMKFSRKQCAL